MQAILTGLAHSTGIAFLVAFGILILFGTPFIWRARRAERRYLLQPGTEVSAHSTPEQAGAGAQTESQTAQDATHTPQEGGQKDGTPRLSARQSTG